MAQSPELFFLDLTKTFDTVNHSILLRKLSGLGVHDAARDWFSSFISNRCQVICCNNAMSDPASISIDVAQVSILGPLLFIITRPRPKRPGAES